MFSIKRKNSPRNLSYTDEKKLFNEISELEAETVSGGAEIFIYRDFNYKGGAIQLKKDQKEFGSLNFNDLASSVKVISGTFTLYRDNNFKGPSITVSAKGGPANNGQYPNSSWLGGRNDYFSSARVNFG